MSLRIYDSNNSESAYSVSGNNTNPYYIAANGTYGEIVEERKYLRNNEVGKVYSGVQLQYLDVGGGLDMVDGTNGISMKLNEGDTQPTESQWDYISPGNTISFPIVSGISSYLPFWSRVEVPSSAPVQLIDDVILKITGTEILS